MGRRCPAYAGRPCAGRHRPGQTPGDRPAARQSADSPGWCNETRRALQGVWGQAVGAQALGQVRGNLLQQRQVTGMLGSGRRQVITLEIKAGAQGVFAQADRRDIAFGTDHRGQRLAVGGLRQPGDLPANTFKGSSALAAKRLTSAAPASTTTGRWPATCHRPRPAIARLPCAVPGLHAARAR